MSPRRRGGGAAAGCLILLVLFVVIAGIILDRVGDRLAENAAATRLGQRGLLEDPRVTINGYPFLTQLVRRDFDDVQVNAPKASLPSGRSTVSLDEVSLRLRGVRPDASYQEATVSQLTGQGRLGWDAVGSYVRAPVRYGGTSNGKGRMQIEYRVRFNGQSVLITASGVPRIDTGTQQLRLDDPKADVAGTRLGSDTVQTMLDKATQPVPLNLPMGLRVQDLAVTEAGLRLGLSGDNITIRQ